VIPAQCAEKYIAYTRNLSYTISDTLRQASGGFPVLCSGEISGEYTYTDKYTKTELLRMTV